MVTKQSEEIRQSMERNLSRRDFAKNALFAVAGIGLVSSLGLEEFERGLKPSAKVGRVIYKVKPVAGACCTPGLLAYCERAQFETFESAVKRARRRLGSFIVFKEFVLGRS